MQPAFEVSWHAIEPHWKVVGRGGEDLGEVHAVVGDRDEDIFDGLAITRRGGPSALHAVVDKPRYVGYEQVAGIEQGLVRLRIDAAQADQLPPHEAAETLRILPEGRRRREAVAGREGGGPSGPGRRRARRPRSVGAPRRLSMSEARDGGPGHDPPAFSGTTVAGVSFRLWSPSYRRRPNGRRFCLA